MTVRLEPRVDVQLLKTDRAHDCRSRLQIEHGIRNQQGAECDVRIGAARPFDGEIAHGNLIELEPERRGVCAQQEIIVAREPDRSRGQLEAQRIVQVAPDGPRLEIGDGDSAGGAQRIQLYSAGPVKALAIHRNRVHLIAILAVAAGRKLIERQIDRFNARAERRRATQFLVADAAIAQSQMRNRDLEWLRRFAR